MGSGGGYGSGEGSHPSSPHTSPLVSRSISMTGLNVFLRECAAYGSVDHTQQAAPALSEANGSNVFKAYGASGCNSGASPPPLERSLSDAARYSTIAAMESAAADF
mmetsp:Transcript_30471/g.68343  ORF Transcript_30471/g.68343 Transcript_30471/m.68343 type:complete len:106 (+) Transcript_30471:683-1000(+)